MKTILIALLLCGCVDTKEDTYKLTDSVGRTEGYIRSDGAITDSVGRVEGYIENVD